MTSHVITSFDSHHQTIYKSENYVHKTYSSTRNQTYHPYLTTLPIPSIRLCERLLFETKIDEDVGSATTSSYIHSSEHYDNTYSHTYDNPIECLEGYNMKQSLIVFPENNENLYDNTKGEEINDHNKSRTTSPIFFYLENKSLAVYGCIISLLLLLIIAIGIFLINKFIRPVVINTTVNNHYDIMNISTTLVTPQSTHSSILAMLLTQSTDIPITTTTVVSCPPDRWGIECKNVCKPCGLGVCHTVTGKCICPDDIYGEFCDLWKVDDKPKRGDMTS